MNNLITIEHKNIRVLTTQQLAEVYETDTNNIQKNFANNKERFIEGRDYYLLQGEELRAFKRDLNNIQVAAPNVNQLYLWTSRGANRHCKILDTDQAWKQFDILEETYFHKTAQLSLPQGRDLLALAIIEAKKIIEEKDALLEIQKPKVIFADAVAVSQTSILVGELAKILKQNGIDIGQNRLFEWLRQNDYLIKRKGTDYNMPTQYSMQLGLFEIKETTVAHSDGHTTISKTPKVTGKGQIYFINKFQEEFKRGA